MRKLLCLLWVPLVLLMASCATSKYPITKYGHDIPDSLFNRIEYLLRPGDKVALQSFNNLSSVQYESTINNGAGGAQVPVYETTVDNNGYMVVPKAGRVKVGGLTQREATLEINKIYEDILNDPQFNLTISTMKVNVLGAVNVQGIYVMTRENMTLSDAFALAGGVKYDNMSKKLMIIRNGKTMEFSINAAQMADPRLNAIIIKDNDIVYVKPSGASISAPKISQYTAFLAPIGTILNAFSLYYAIQSITK